MLKKYVRNAMLMSSVFGLSMLARPVWAAHTDACKADKEKFCSNVDPKDHKAMHACLKENEAQLSDACKTQMAKHMHGKKPTTPSTGQSGTNAPANAPAAAPAPAPTTPQ